MNYLDGSRVPKKLALFVFGVLFVVLAAILYIFHPITVSVHFPQEKSSKIDGSVLAERPAELAAQRIFWKEQIQKYGAEEAYRAFGEGVDKIAIDSHTQAHIFGEALYEVVGMEGIRICDSNFRFGCYHSFFGVAIHNEGIEILPDLDAHCKKAFGNDDTRCQHGIGHGLLVYTGYENLVEALELCATFQWQPTGSCTGGVFMEYNFHTMEQTEDLGYTRDPNGALYEPCISLPKKFQTSCYHEQVQWWLDVFDNDFVYVGTLCKPLVTDYASWEACYQRVGNFFTEAYGADYDGMIDMCSQMENEEADYICREGSTFPMTGVSEFRETRLRICETLDGEVRQRCIDFVDGFGG